MDPILLILVSLLVACGAGIWYFGRVTAAAAATPAAHETEKPTGSFQPPALFDAAQLDERREEFSAADEEEDANFTTTATTNHALHNARLQRRRQEKERAKQERRDAREAAVEQRRHAAEEAEHREQQRREREIRSEALEEDTLDELRREAQRQQEGEYRGWLGQMELQAEGQLGCAEQQDAVLRSALLDAARRDRVICLDDFCRRVTCANDEKDEAAPPVSVRPTVERVVKLIEQLKGGGLLGGVFDDRGKFICITDDECQQIARFIHEHNGRVTREALVSECNRLLQEQAPRADNTIHDQN